MPFAARMYAQACRSMAGSAALLIPLSLGSWLLAEMAKPAPLSIGLCLIGILSVLYGLIFSQMVKHYQEAKMWRFFKRAD